MGQGKQTACPNAEDRVSNTNRKLICCAVVNVKLVAASELLGNGKNSTTDE